MTVFFYSGITSYPGVSTEEKTIVDSHTVHFFNPYHWSTIVARLIWTWSFNEMQLFDIKKQGLHWYC